MDEMARNIDMTLAGMEPPEEPTPPVPAWEDDWNWPEDDEDDEWWVRGPGGTWLKTFEPEPRHSWTQGWFLLEGKAGAWRIPDSAWRFRHKEQIFFLIQEEEKWLAWDGDTPFTGETARRMARSAWRDGMAVPQELVHTLFQPL